MAYGILKVDTITFTDGGVDKSVTISGLVQNPTFTGNVTVTGTISGDTVRGQTISGVTVTGTTAQFTSGTFVSLTGTTLQGTTATYTTGSFTSLTGTTTSGTTANFVSGVFSTQISGATVTGTTANFTSGNFTNISGGTHTITSGVFALGTATNPSISFTSDPNTGIYSPGADQVAISTNGTGRLFVDASGNVSLGQASSALQSGGTGLTIYGASASEIKLLNSTTGSANTDGTALVVINSDFTINNREAGGIFFGTSNAERMRLDSSGRLGLGTSAPGTALHIVASTTGNPLLRLTDNSGVGGGSRGSSLDLQGISNDTGTVATTFARIYGLKTNGTQGNTQGFFRVDTDNGSGLQTALIIDSSQRVGVGTTNPQRPLDVNGSVRLSSGSVIEFGGTVTNFITGDNSSNYLAFGTNSSERARIDSSGRLGLGTSSPSSILHVSGTAGTPVVFERTSTTGTFIALKDSASQTFIGNTNGVFSIQTPGSSYSDKLVVTSAGNVGIGTTSPSDTNNFGNALDVNGTTGSALYVRTNGSATNFGIIGHYGTDFYVNNNSNGPTRFFTNGSERARIDSSGRLLVGTSTSASAGDSQYSKLQIRGNTSGNPQLGIISIQRDEAASAITTGEGIGEIVFTDNAGNTFAAVVCEADANAGSGDYPGRLTFSTTADGASSPTERMRIGSNGYVQFSETGTYSPDATSGWHKFYQSADQRCIQTYSTSSTFTNYSLIQYIAAGGGTGSGFASGYSDNGSIQRYIIFSNGNIQNTNNSYAGISDIKLKENIADANSQWLDIKSLQVRNYNLKHSPGHRQIGVIAQEIEQISPGLVTESPDRDAEGNDLGTVTKSVNYSVLYMKAVKALQEAMERIETLEAKVAALEGV